MDLCNPENWRGMYVYRLGQSRATEALQPFSCGYRRWNIFSSLKKSRKRMSTTPLQKDHMEELTMPEAANHHCFYYFVTLDWCIILAKTEILLSVILNCVLPVWACNLNLDLLIWYIYLTSQGESAKSDASPEKLFLIGLQLSIADEHINCSDLL